jgi:hypothetical protein
LVIETDADWASERISAPSLRAEVLKTQEGWRENFS